MGIDTQRNTPANLVGAQGQRTYIPINYTMGMVIREWGRTKGKE